MPEVKATEYVAPGGRARGWYVPCGWWDERPFVGSAILTSPGYVYPWEYVVREADGWRFVAYAKRLTFARMQVLGGNGHIERGHSSVAELREMTLPNILALTAR